MRRFFIISRLRSQAARHLSALVLGIALLLHFPARMVFAQATGFPNVPPLLVGAAWYPEQWSEATWDHDLALMEAGNIHLVRVGEFAWSSIEPSEGQYKLDWLERGCQSRCTSHCCGYGNALCRAPGLAYDSVS